MLYIYLPVSYYHGNLYVTEGAYPGGRGFPLSQRSFLFYLFFLLVSFAYYFLAAPLPTALVLSFLTILKKGVMRLK